MKVQEILKRVRFTVNESDTPVLQRAWADDELMVYMTASIQDMFIQQVEANESYHNFEFSVDSDAKGVNQIHSSVTVYPLPYLVHRIYSVRFVSKNSSSRQTDIPARTMRNRSGTFWTHDGLNRIRVYGDPGRGVTIEASKIPARLTEGTVPALTDVDTFELAPSASTLSFKHEDSKFEIEEEPNAYANAVIEVTGVNVRGHLVSGQRRRIIGSEIKFTNNNKIYTELTMDRSWDTVPLQSDTWTMLPEISETHMELIVLRVAEKCWRRKPNPTAMQAIANDLMREELRFRNAIEIRQEQELNVAGMDRDDVVFINDPDRITGRLV